MRALVKSDRFQGRFLLAVLAIGLLTRTAVVIVLHQNLSADVDAYLGIAHGLADGRGFSAPGSTAPTAYRPPLYPVMLAAIILSGGGAVTIGVVHVLLGTATVGLTWAIGRKLQLGNRAGWAAALVALDPLLLLYASYPMTETLFTFLVALLLLRIAVSNADKSNAPPRRWRQAVTGGVFGLCALCRPTTWPFAVLLAMLWLGRHWRTLATTPVRTIAAALPWPALLAAALTISPWLVRNLVVFHRPILTTTHGGYTLLLGNNPVFYRQVVEKPWGTVWNDAPPGKRQADWYADVEARMRNELPAAATEIERDRWLSRRARMHIADEPGTFLQACWLRVRRLWNIVPLGDSARQAPPPALWAIGLFYLIENVGAAVGLFRLRRGEWRRWLPLLLLCLSVTAVHLVYWSNARMRAPLIPAIALLAVRGLAVNRNPQPLN